LSAANPQQFAEVSEDTARWTRVKGYPPNSWLTMVRRPQVFRAYRNLHNAVMMEAGAVPQGLKFLIAQAVSRAAGDRYCEAHNAQNAANIGQVAIDKVQELAQFETSAHFTAAERAALRLAQAAGSHPPAVSDEHFADLQRHYTGDAIAEIVAVISLLGWLNRWCQTLATAIEPDALAFAQEHLAAGGWTWPQERG
jgi:uncharacterized peroxidase-related enzyme